MRSAEDDDNNNKRLRSVSFKLKPGPRKAFTIGPYTTRCFRRPSVPPCPCLAHLLFSPMSQPLHPGYRSPEFSLIVQNPSSNNLLTRARENESFLRNFQRESLGAREINHRLSTPTLSRLIRVKLAIARHFVRMRDETGAIWGKRGER